MNPMSDAPSVYVETSVVGYAASRRSRDLITAARQRSTADWFEAQAKRLRLYISQMVLDEISAGDPQAAQERLDFVKDLPVLEMTNESRELASILLNEGALPYKAVEDALHVAIAATNGMDFLVTWNCKHIANAFMRPVISKVCRTAGFEPPIICTPEELSDAT
jgi:predicted nucleic acid-binding protein